MTVGRPWHEYPIRERYDRACDERDEARAEIERLEKQVLRYHVALSSIAGGSLDEWAKKKARETLEGE